MNKKFFISALALSAMALGASAQTVTDDPSSSFGARTSIGVEKKVAKGFTVGLEEELRFSDDFKSYTTLGADLKVAPHLKVGAGYTFIYRQDEMRHRAFVNLTENFKSGNWTFSLRERVQMTHRTADINTWQNPRNLVESRVRFKASYKVPGKKIEPYGMLEEKNTLNAVKYTTTEASSMSYSDIYLNRMRCMLGVEWKIAKHQTLDIGAFYDYTYRKSIDAKRSTGTLKTITLKPGNNVNFAISYKIRL